MGFSRYEAKMRAKASMRGAYPHPMLVTLVYILMTVVLMYVVIFLCVGSLFAQMAAYIAMGYDSMDVMMRLHPMLAMPGLFLGLTILLSLYMSVVGFGYTSYSLRLARNEQPGYRNLLDGFAMMGRVLLLYILQMVFLFLWALLGMVPMFLVLILSIVTQSSVLAVLAPLLYWVAFLLVVVMSYRYRLGAYFLLDHPNMGALEAITASKNAMRGWKWTLFVVDLSFLGWQILSSFTFGILGLWVQPYMMATVANFYDFVVHGGYSSPDFRQNPYGTPNGRPRPGQNQGPEF